MIIGVGLGVWVEVGTIGTSALGFSFMTIGVGGRVNKMAGAVGNLVGISEPHAVPKITKTVKKTNNLPRAG